MEEPRVRRPFAFRSGNKGAHFALCRPVDQPEKNKCASGTAGVDEPRKIAGQRFMKPGRIEVVNQRLKAAEREAHLPALSVDREALLTQPAAAQPLVFPQPIAYSAHTLAKRV